MGDALACSQALAGGSITVCAVGVKAVVRIDTFNEFRDLENYPLHDAPAATLRQRGESSVTGSSLAGRFPTMCHYTGIDSLAWIKRHGIRPNTWVSPTGYSACAAPYSLGLYDPKDLVVLIDTNLIPELWGPGPAPPGIFSEVWSGGGMEFQLGDAGAPLHSIKHVLPMETCGDTGSGRIPKGGNYGGLIVCSCGARH